MAINSISFPTPQAYSGGVDFSPLANLGNVYQQGQERQAQQAVLGQLGNDPTANAQMLIKSGVPSLAQLGMKLQADQASNAESMREFNARQAISEQTAELAQRKYEEDSPTFRAKQLKDEIDAGRMPPEAVKDPAVRNWILTGEKMGTALSAQKAGLSPIFGTRTDATGKEVPVMLQTTGEGAAVETKLPPGVTVAPNKPLQVDTGTSIMYLDPVTRQLLKEVPKNVAEAAAAKAGGEVTGEAEAKARLDLPKIEQTNSRINNLVDKIISHPGLKSAVGFPSALGLKHIPGSQAADFQALVDQLQGNAFLDAYETMRGAGAISNMEDLKGSAAKLQASVTQSPEQFKEALRDYQRAVNQGLEFARKRAGVKAPETTQSAQPAKADPFGIR